MIKNYFKMAWKVLIRRPFYTIISLTGISLTLMVLMVVVAFYEHSLAPNGVMKNFDRVITIYRVNLSNTEKNSSWSSSAGYQLIKEYVKKLKIPAEISLTTSPNVYKVFNNDRKFELSTRYVDAEYFNILTFDFIKGRAFNVAEVTNADPLAVIDDKTSMDYFGTLESIGKTIKVNDLEYQVVGIVKNVPLIRLHAYAQVFLPYTKSKFNLASDDLLGPFTCNIMAKKSGDIEKIQKEWGQMLTKIKLPNEYNKIECRIETPFDFIMHQLARNASDIFALVMIAILTIMFMSLPSLNLVNLNITRILERSSEIGIRKSFGATSLNLVSQFLVENVFLTLLGGLIGLLLSFITLKIIDASDFIPNSHFSLNLNIFLYCLGLTLIFGLLSGVYPAWKMSRMNIMKALKEEKI